MKKGVRIADEAVYLRTNRYEKPKEITKYCASLFEKTFQGAPGSSILDIGCGSGEFLYYIKKRFPDYEYFGFDISTKLIARAEERVPGVDFQAYSLLEPPYFEGKKFDVVFCLGVVSIFDDIEHTLRCILTATKPGTVVYISSIFNHYPIDSLIVYRPSTIDPNVPWETGFNRFSQQTVNAVIEPLVRKITWYEHKMPFPLPQQDDLMRTWTIRTEHDPHQRINGLLLLCTPYIVEILV